MSKSVVIGRSGESMAGDLVEKSFTIESTFGMALTFKTEDVRWIHFKNPPNVEMDEIWSVTDDRARGKIRGADIGLRVRGRQTVRIPYSKIHTILVNHAWYSSKALTK